MVKIDGFLTNGLDFLMTTAGLSTSVNFIAFTIGSTSYDDTTTQTVAGSSIISGLLLPITSSQGSTEALLLEQGKILTTDKVLFTGSVNTSGNLLIGINGKKYSIIPDGIYTYDVAGSNIYNKFFLRQSITGSLW